MKKIILLYSAVLLVLGASGYSWYISQYKRDNYYVRIDDYNSPSEKEIYEKGRKKTQYTYLVRGYDEKGNSKILKFSTIYKIKPSTYLEVFSNKEKGSIEWIGRNRSEIPKNALEHLE